VVLVTPDRFRSVPCPSYPEIRLAIKPGRKVGKLIEDAQPCAVHIATLLHETQTAFYDRLPHPLS
jgi:hypothetical protein